MRLSASCKALHRQASFQNSINEVDMSKTMGIIAIDEEEPCTPNKDVIYLELQEIFAFTVLLILTAFLTVVHY